MGSRLKRILQAALLAADPYLSVWQHLQRNGNRLLSAGRTYDLDQVDRVWLVGVGKASLPMLSASIELLGEKLAGGVIAVKEFSISSQDRNCCSVEILESAHPVPDERSIEAARKIMTVAQQAGSGDLLVVLISGGGSSLMTLPVPGVLLAELQILTQSLLRSGATITQVNTVRKHLDQIKGGGLIEHSSAGRVLTLILSDVIGDPLDVIASGPTVPDASSFKDAHDILVGFRLWDDVPEGIRAHIVQGMNGTVSETPRPGDPRFERVQNVLIGSNRMAVEAALHQAGVEGFEPHVLPQPLIGEAAPLGEWLAGLGKRIQAAQSRQAPLCVIAGGETTVTVRGAGRGGRNQELALGAVRGLADVPGALLVTLATDGQDGDTPAAGAVISSDTLSRAQHLGLDPLQYLRENDSYSFFKQLDDLVITGPTLTNVNDIAVLVIP